MSRPPSPLSLARLGLLAGALAASAGALRAEDATPKAPDAAAEKSGDKARAALPLPAEGNGFRYEGELWEDGLWGGTLKLTAEAGSLNDEACWLVTEDLFWDFQSTEWRVGLSATLRRDLRVERAEIELKTKTHVTRFTLARNDTGWTGQKQVIQGENEGPFEDVVVHAPKNATMGLTALALLGRGPLPANEAPLALPWLDVIGFARGTASGVATLRAVSAKAPGTFDASPGKPASLALALEGLAAPAVAHLDPKGRLLLGTTGLIAPKVTVLKAGVRPEGVLDEKGPARTWQTAFLKFGVGYHMARRELLEVAFHWETMYEYETSLVDGWPKEKPLAEFREAWIGEFLNQSLRRKRAETDELLRMTLATGRVEEKSPDRLVFHAHKNFGGGTARSYYFRRFDGIWYLVRMEDTPS